MSDLTIERISIASIAFSGNDISLNSSISQDGRFIVFESRATNLVFGDSNSSRDIFLYDRQTGVIERVSIASNAAQGNAASVFPDISADGRFVVFASEASNLVAADTNGSPDVFVHDSQTGTTKRISVASNGTQANSSSFYVSISADGRFAAFSSSASNLVNGDTNGTVDIFVHDIQTGTTERVSVDSNGNQANGGSTSTPTMSANGAFVAFESAASNLVTGDQNGTWDIFVRDRQSGATQKISVNSNGIEGNGPSEDASISADGRFVAFSSFASNLVSGDTNGAWDVFIHDRQTGKTERVSINDDEIQGDGSSWNPSVSSDGRFIAFYSGAQNLISEDTNGVSDVFVRDRLLGITKRVSVDSDGIQSNSHSGNPAISDNGRFVAFSSIASNLSAGDLNHLYDVFLYDFQNGVIQIISAVGVEGNGASREPSISSDGRFVAFLSYASNLVAGDTNGTNDVFVHDLETGETTRVSVSSSGSQGNGGSLFPPSISADGRLIAFTSFASNLVVGDTNGADDVFVHDRHTGATERISIASGGTQGNAQSFNPSISADGRYVAFESAASNLVAGDTAEQRDIFVYDRQTGAVERVSVASNGAQANDDSFDPSISADGRFVAFESYAENLGSNDTNGATDIYVYDREAHVTERISITGSGTQGNGAASSPSISADGRFVAFQASSSNLVVGDSNGSDDIFVYDRQEGSIERVSVASDGTGGNAMSRNPSISADGRFIAFESRASNLVVGDTNDGRDLFVHDRLTGITQRASLSESGLQGNNGQGTSDLTPGSIFASISADGKYIAFQSYASNLVGGDTNKNPDIFVVSNALASIGSPPQQSLIDVFRFYNGGTGTHFYTGSEAEKDQIVANPGNDPFLAKMVFEGPAYKAFGQDGAEATELYRFYNTATGAHFFTASEGEKNHIVANPANDPFLAAMTLEGVAYYVLGQDGAHAIDVWRFYNGATGVHFYTASESEKDHIVANPGNDPYLTHLVLEGVGFWVPDQVWVV